MKRSILLILIAFPTLVLMCQEKFPLSQLTFEPAQQGFPSWSPDGKYIVFQQTDMQDSTETNGLWAMKMDDMSKIQVFSGIAEHPRWSPDDRFIVFDAKYGEDIQMIPVGGGDPIEFLPHEIKIFRGGLPCWSPDGGKLAFKEGNSYFVWVYDLKSKELTKISDDKEGLTLPGCWSRDGKNVLLGVRNQETNISRMWKVAADGSGREEIKGQHENFYRYMELSPDGEILAYVTFNLEDRTSSIWAMPSNGGKSIELVSPPGFNEAPNWSPDGSRIAFISTRSGNFNVWMVQIDIKALKKELNQ